MDNCLILIVTNEMIFKQITLDRKVLQINHELVSLKTSFWYPRFADETTVLVKSKPNELSRTIAPPRLERSIGDGT